MSVFNQVTVLRRAVEVAKREFTDKQRKGAAKTGEAMPDGSFPIGNVEDLHSAVLLMHNAADPSEAKDHIMRRATALGAESELPAAWGAGKKKPVKKEEVEKGGPGSGPRKGSGGKHQSDPARGAARWPPANPNDALPKPEPTVEFSGGKKAMAALDSLRKTKKSEIDGIVSTMITVQKDWAAFDAQRAGDARREKELNDSAKRMETKVNASAKKMNAKLDHTAKHFYDKKSVLDPLKALFS